LRECGATSTARRALERLIGPHLDGFWIHLDADVLDPAVMPAVDSPDPGGLSLDTVAELLVPLVRHPKALGFELTIYDPGLDPDGACARRLVALLERVFAGGRS
jgi:arginase